MEWFDPAKLLVGKQSITQLEERREQNEQMFTFRLIGRIGMMIPTEIDFGIEHCFYLELPRILYLQAMFQV